MDEELIVVLDGRYDKQKVKTLMEGLGSSLKLDEFIKQLMVPLPTRRRNFWIILWVGNFNWIWMAYKTVSYDFIIHQVDRLITNSIHIYQKPRKAAATIYRLGCLGCLTHLF